MGLYSRIINKEEKISIIGLGYVGLPIAVAFSEHADVIAFDTNQTKIDLYNSGVDVTNEVGNQVIKNCNVLFTCDEIKLSESKFHIVAVPTPINIDKTPNLKAIEDASRIIGRNLTKGSIVVYESTVYPGVTEEICVPILEKESGLNCGVDFKVGYSPERINPSDKVNTLQNIIKVVSGMDAETLDTVAKVYEIVAKAGVHRAESIKVAEAAKVIENSQRDINIAFMNELSIIFNKLGIDTNAVLKAAKTKWNFLDFRPGLVGGHCIGVDPYYLTHKAEQVGYHSEVILAGRRINDGMGKHIAEITVKKIISAKNRISEQKIGILGFTFKENCQDTRNTKVFDIVKELNEYNIYPIICDPVANAEEAHQLYGVNLVNISEMRDLDALIIAVNHNEFLTLTIEEIETMLKPGSKILIDVKGILNKFNFVKNGYNYWRL